MIYVPNRDDGLLFVAEAEHIRKIDNFLKPGEQKVTLWAGKRDFYERGRPQFARCVVQWHRRDGCGPN